MDKAFPASGITKGMESATSIIKAYSNPIDPDVSKYIAKKHGLNQSDIIDFWRAYGKHSDIFGTCIHNTIKAYYNGHECPIDGNWVHTAKASIANFNQQYGAMASLLRKPVYTDTHIEKSYGMFHSFLSDSKGAMECCAIERVIHSSELNAIGTLDALYHSSKTRKFHIVEWKTGKDIGYYSKYSRNMLKGLNHLQDCKFIVYSLQLSIYRLIMEHSLGMDFGESYMVWISPLKQEYQIIKAIYLKEEALMMLESRGERINPLPI